MGDKKIYWILAIVLIVGAVLYFIFGKEEEIKNYPSSGTDIIAFGDSLVQGVGASSKDKNFVSLLSYKIGRPITNLGISGNTTKDGLSRLTEFDDYKPKVVLLLLGGNDYLRKVPIEETFINLGKIIEDLQDRGAVVILLGVRGGIIGDNFDTEFEKLEKKYKVAYVPDVLDGLITNPKYMSDAIHPNDAGYAKIVDRIYPILNKLIK